MDGIALALLAHRAGALCEEMGVVLRRTALSPNIKDRLDYSCALFDAEGALFAQAAHIPVHLGSMAYALRDVVREFPWAPGDAVVFNDPFLGGTHLPDVTVVVPAFLSGTLLGFAVTRAHTRTSVPPCRAPCPCPNALRRRACAFPPPTCCTGA